jgi:NAD(P)-dependent dehydrogenase (short-subunit alcohol dehydrogenase family)
MRNLWPRLALLSGTLLSLPGWAALDAEQPTVLITGTNRGIGLEFVRQFSEHGWNVIATARKPAEAEELRALADADDNIVIEQLDVTDHARVDELAAQYKDQPIDVLLSNAALTPRYPSAFKPLAGVDLVIARQSYEINALGPLKLVQAFMEHVAASNQKKIVAMSSRGGSFTESPKMPMMYEYRGSKAALNMYMYVLSLETQKRGVIAVILSPGTVNTTPGFRMPNALEPPESVAKMLDVIAALEPEDNGKFLNHENGEVIPW